MASNEPFGIYSIVNTQNQKIYVGSCSSSSGFKRRWTVHKSSLKNNKHYNKHLQSAWNKYGKDAFIFNILEILESDESVSDREQYYINLYGCFNHNIGYNISKNTLMPMLGMNHTDEAKKKIGLASIGNKHCLGYKHSIETKEKMSKSRQNISLETRKKMSLKLLGNKRSLGITPVNIVSVNQLDINNNFVKSWKSITDAANSLNLQITNIIKVCRGKRITCGGFKWQYK